MARLSKLEKQAVRAVISERLAGCVEDLRDAFGVTDKEAEKMWEKLESAADKLAERVAGREEPKE